MIRFHIYARNIDYNAFIELAMPYIVKWLSEKDNFFYEILKKIISKKGKPTAFSKILVTLLPKKAEMAAAILPHFDDILMEYLNNSIIPKYASAEVVSMKMDTIERRHDTMLRIEINIDDINYEKTAEALLPTLITKLSDKNETSAKVARLLKDLGELPNQVLAGALGAIPEKQRDELTAKILTEFADELVTMLNSVVTANNIKADISDIKVDSL